MSQPFESKHDIDSLKQVDETTLAIIWKDGFESRYKTRDLRLKCPCAQCVDEMTGKIILVSKLVPHDVHPASINPIGRYALRIHWSDGHDTGIYPFKLLRDLGEK
jgi:ATP-binding protein involved in chromosome partitioning